MVTKKSALTGAIVLWYQNFLKSTNFKNVTNSLVGVRVTGLTAIQTGGQPGNNSATISIRGSNIQ
jgi:hypothetical protein